MRSWHVDFHHHLLLEPGNRILRPVRLRSDLALSHPQNLLLADPISNMPAFRTFVSQKSILRFLVLRSFVSCCFTLCWKRGSPKQKEIGWERRAALTSGVCGGGGRDDKGCLEPEWGRCQATAATMDLL